MGPSIVAPTDTTHPLDLGPLILGGAGFSYQLTHDPSSVPAVPILSRAFALGVRTIDTSPYYHPSEEILGAALADPTIASLYKRSDYKLMTKCGRIEADKFDYSPAWIHASVARSLQRFRTDYLDVVFCHDVEYVTLDEAVGAVGALLELKAAGKVRFAGISGYGLDVLTAVAREVRVRYGRPVDVVQNWAQLTLQNTALETRGLARLRDQGVRAVCSSSPLACGLLRDGGVPVGALGDWHPAPEALRARSQLAAEKVAVEGEELSALALRFAVRSAVKNTDEHVTVSTITGIGSLSDLEENVASAKQVLGEGLSLRDRERPSQKADDDQVRRQLAQKDERLFGVVRDVLGKEWIDYDFSSPANTTATKA